jgi:hypothetical protein
MTTREKKGVASAVLVVAVTAVAFDRHVKIVPQVYARRNPGLRRPDPGGPCFYGTGDALIS